MWANSYTWSQCQHLVNIHPSILPRIQGPRRPRTVNRALEILRLSKESVVPGLKPQALYSFPKGSWPAYEIMNSPTYWSQKSTQITMRTRRLNFCVFVHLSPKCKLAEEKQIYMLNERRHHIPFYSKDGGAPPNTGKRPTGHRTQAMNTAAPVQCLSAERSPTSTK